MNNLTKQMGKLEVNQYKQLQHGLKNALDKFNPPTTSKGMTYTPYNPTKNSYPANSYYNTIFSKNGKSRKTRKASRKQRKATRKQRKH